MAGRKRGDRFVLRLLHGVEILLVAGRHDPKRRPAPRRICRFRSRPVAGSGWCRAAAAARRASCPCAPSISSSAICSRSALPDGSSAIPARPAGEQPIDLGSVAVNGPPWRQIESRAPNNGHGPCRPGSSRLASPDVIANVSAASPLGVIPRMVMLGRHSVGTEADRLVGLENQAAQQDRLAEAPARAVGHASTSIRRHAFRRSRRPRNARVRRRDQQLILRRRRGLKRWHGAGVRPATAAKHGEWRMKSLPDLRGALAARGGERQSFDRGGVKKSPGTSVARRPLEAAGIPFCCPVGSDRAFVFVT